MIGAWMITIAWLVEMPLWLRIITTILGGIKILVAVGETAYEGGKYGGGNDTKKLS